MSERRVTRPGVVVPVRVDPTGRTGPTPGRARGPHWRRTSPGLFVPASVDGSVLDQRLVEVACGLPAGAALTGWAALGWLRPQWFNGLASDGRTPLPVPVALDDDRTLAPREGVVLTNDWLFDDDVVEVDGVPVTVPARSVTFAVRRTKLIIMAVQTIDMAAAADLVSIEELVAYADRIGPRGGTRLLRRATGLADENAWSPLEVTMRVVWELEGNHPRPLTNVPIFDRDGNHLLTPDLLDPCAGVAGEYDGGHHLEPLTRRRDLGREALYRDLGIETVTMMSGDLRDTSDFLRRLAGAYRRARGPGAVPSWTLEQPDWWVDTSTVASRRGLDADQRARWLRRAA